MIRQGDLRINDNSGILKTVPQDFVPWNCYISYIKVLVEETLELLENPLLH